MSRGMPLDLLVFVPGIALALVQLSMLPVDRRRVVFALAACAGFTFLSILARSWEPARLYSLFGLVGSVVVPLFFYAREVRVWERLVAVMVSNLLLVTAEFAVVSFESAMGGGWFDAEFAANAPLVEVAVFLMDAGIVLVGGLVVSPLVWRLHGQGASLPSGGAGALFVASPIASPVLAIGFLVWYVPLYEPLPYVPGLILALSFIGNVVLLAAEPRYRRARVERRRADELQARLDGCLAAYAELMADADEAARLRHDLRNHLQVAAALLEREGPGAAEEYVAELERSVAGDAAGGAVEGAVGNAAGA